MLRSVFWFLVLVLFFGGSEKIFSGVRVRVHLSPEDPDHLEEKAEKCILSEGRDFPYAEVPHHSTPLFWPSQMVGADLSYLFTKKQPDLSTVTYATHEKNFYFSSLDPIHQDRLEKGVHLAFVDEVNSFIIGNFPVGTGISAKLSFLWQNTPPQQTARIADAEWSEEKVLSLLKQQNRLPLLVLDKYEMKMAFEPFRENFLFVLPMKKNGFPVILDHENDKKRTLLVPRYGNIITQTDKGISLSSERTIETALAISALSNALAIAPSLSPKALIDWAIHTSHHSLFGSAYSGVGILNAYKLARVAARLREKCQGKEFVLCESQWRSDEKKRTEILNFESESIEKFQAGKAILNSLAPTCAQKQEAFQLMREAHFLSPETRKYQLELARLLELDGFMDAAKTLSQGADASIYLEDLSLWAFLSETERRTIQKLILDQKKDEGEVISIVKKGMQSKNPKSKMGASHIATILPDKYAVAFLRDFLKEKDWLALAQLNAVVQMEKLKPAPKAKFAHYISIMKSAIESLRGEKNLNINQLSHLSDYYSVLRQLIEEDLFTLEEQRHLLDLGMRHSLTGGNEHSRLIALQFLIAVYPSGSEYQINFLRKYIDRSLLHIVRTSEDTEVVKQAWEELARTDDKRLLLNLLHDRALKDKKFKPLLDSLILKWGTE